MCKLSESVFSWMYKWKFIKTTTIISKQNKQFSKTDNTEWSVSWLLTLFNHLSFDEIKIKWDYLWKTNVSGSPTVTLALKNDAGTAFYTSWQVSSANDWIPVEITLSKTSNKASFTWDVINRTATIQWWSYTNKFYLYAYGLEMNWYKLTYKPSLKVFDNKNIGEKLTGYLFWILPDWTRWNWNQDS